MPATAGTNNEVWLDHTSPSDPTLTGGSTTWKNVASETLNVSGSTDNGGSGFAGYRYQTSTDGGITWSAMQIGGSLQVASEGETLVRFRAVDNIGNWSSWVTGTVRIDRTSPTNPVLTGGTSGWTALASRTVSRASSSDSGGSLLSGYRYETSTDNGGHLVGSDLRRLGDDHRTGYDPGAVPGARPHRQRLWLGAGDGAARPHRAHRTGGRRRAERMAQRGQRDADRVRRRPTAAGRR